MSVPILIYLALKEAPAEYSSPRAPLLGGPIRQGFPVCVSRTRIAPRFEVEDIRHLRSDSGTTSPECDRMTLHPDAGSPVQREAPDAVPIVTPSSLALSVC